MYPKDAVLFLLGLNAHVFVAKSRSSGDTIICGTRYGNVMASRGSVIPHFHEQIKSGKNITVTNPDMTRFMMTLEDAVELVLFAFNNGNSGDIFVQKSPAASVGLLAETMKKIYNSSVDIKYIGIRHAEKMHETLLSKEERILSEDLGNYFRIPADNRELNYDKYFSEGISNDTAIEYNSSNTKQLEYKSLSDLLNKIGYNGFK